MKCTNHTSSLITMQAFVGLLVLSLALAANGASLTGRIVGGTDAAEGQYPYQVSMWVDGRFSCGGSIINNRYILTAAHCISGIEASQVRIVVGSYFLSKQVKTIQAEKLIGHTGFSFDSGKHDIALIRLSEDIVYNDKIQPIALPSRDYQQEGFSAVLTGWGHISYEGASPDKLQQIHLKVIDLEACQRHHSSVGSTQLCTLTKKGEGTCNGDSGGPLVANRVQIGIVSWSILCAYGSPDVYTRVRAYRDWIDEHMEAY